MSQLIELLWRNKAYVEGCSDPHVSYPNRKGAMFAGFTTEMGFDNNNTQPSKKVRHEYINYDRVAVYPGVVQDHSNTYNIGPVNGTDPASTDLPANLQIPRTIKTDVFNANNRLEEGAAADYHDRPEDGYGYGSKATDVDNFKAKPDAKGRPPHLLNPGMMVRKQERFADDTDPVSSEYTSASFVEDIDFQNAGDTWVSIDLNDSIAGVGAILKKVVVQCSKADHHISEVCLDFSDVTRTSGSISSSENPQSNLLTILLDGKEKVHTAYFDCKMGKFGSSKFKLGLNRVRYFPPLSCEAGGFDSGSQVAQPGDLYFSCEKKFEPSIDNADIYKGTARDGETVEGAGDGTVDLDIKEEYGRHPMQSWPNTLRGIPNDYICGQQMVADSINAGYNLIGVDASGAPAAVQSYMKTAVPGTTSDLLYNSTKTQEQNDMFFFPNPTGEEIVNDCKINWLRTGCSTYTFKPRQPRGTILAINVVLQADGGI